MYKFVFPIRAISKDNFKCMGKNGRFFLSKEYKQFEENLRVMFLSQKPFNFKRFERDPLFVGLTYYFKNAKHSDLFNLPKSTLDAFNGIIWKDDRQIKSGSLDCFDVEEKEAIVMEVSVL